MTHQNKISVELNKILNKLLCLKFLYEKKSNEKDKKCTYEELRDQGFEFPTSTFYRYLTEWEKGNLIIKNRLSQGKKNYFHINYCSTDDLSEFLFFIKQEIMEFLKKFCKSSPEEDVSLEIMRDVVAKFKYNIIPHIVAQIKDYLDKLKSQEDDIDFKGLEEQMFEQVKSIIEYPFLIDLISESSQRWRVREPT